MSPLWPGVTNVIFAVGDCRIGNGSGRISPPTPPAVLLPARTWRSALAWNPAARAGSNETGLPVPVCRAKPPNENDNLAEIDQ